MKSNLEKLIEALELIIEKKLLIENSGPDFEHFKSDCSLPFVEEDPKAHKVAEHNRIMAIELLGCHDVKIAIESIENWEIRIHSLKNALDFGWYERDLIHKYMSRVAEFVKDLRSLPPAPTESQKGWRKCQSKSKAAEWLGIDRSTVGRAVKSGKPWIRMFGKRQCEIDTTDANVIEYRR